jgi:hypothetical protein
VSRIPLIGRRCTTEPHFTAHICRFLKLEHPQRLPEETDQQYLSRRLQVLQWISRQWMRADLAALSPEELRTAAVQICNQAADYCQDRAAERAQRLQRQRPRAERLQPVILDMHRSGARSRQIAYELELEERLVQEIIDWRPGERTA